MKKKENQFPESLEPILEPKDPPPSEEATAIADPAMAERILFARPEEEAIPPSEAPENTPFVRQSHRFRVKSVTLSGKTLPEGTRLRDASRAITEKSPKPAAKKDQEKKKVPASSASGGKAMLSEIFSQVPEAEEKKAEKKKAKFGVLDYVRYAMLFVCFTIFLYSSYTLINSLIERAQSRELYDSLSDLFHRENPFVDSYLNSALPNTPSVDLLSAYVGVEPEEQTVVIRDQSAQTQINMVNYLKNNKNKDTIGWIIIDGTNIDYPVVHTKDNDYYLRRSYEGKSNLSGTLFTDYRNSPKLMENRNTVIYGHNMSDGSMFNNIHDFAKEEIFNNSKIQMITPNGIFIYEVFSVHEAYETSEYFQTEFSGDDHFAAYLEEMLGESLFQKEGLELNPGDKVLTLSTCMDPIIQSEYRWAVHAKLVEVINYTP